MSKLKDSGKRAKYNNGAVRDTAENKGRFDLLPAYAIFRLARHFEEGAKKYEDRNWEKGIPTHRYLDSAMRHLFKFVGGMTDEDHLTASAWNILCLIETKYRIEQGILPKELDTLKSTFESLNGVEWKDFYNDKETE